VFEPVKKRQKITYQEGKETIIRSIRQGSWLNHWSTTANRKLLPLSQLALLLLASGIILLFKISKGLTNLDS